MTSVPGVLAHGGHAPFALIGAPALPAVLLAVYLAGVVRVRRAGGRPWSGWRTAAFTAGALCLAVALAPPVAGSAHGDFRAHMVQHLLIGMYAPLGLVLGAPVTLALRTLDARAGRRVTGFLNLPPVHVLAHPLAALLLSAGGLYVLYATPLYAAAAANPLLHQLVHLHFLLSGCLFAWAVAGPDPAPRRPPVPFRLVVLGIAIAAHATLAQLLYAGAFAALPADADQMRGAAEIMYYGGDIAELLLAFALVTTWRPRRSMAVAADTARVGHGR
ncbi:cytochrome c oxidase assembly protein [Actinomadura fulvescens]|uniref:Cytochrome c oxidase assembly protein n=1 Tax=Actinomadura fulvescens TaxID=46160 RepID=A0ABN3PTF5_9ACTN